MALPLQDTTGTPLAVSWVRANAVDPLIVASQLGYFTTPDFKNAKQTIAYPMDVFGGIFQGDPGDMLVVILNTLRTPLDLVEMYLAHGYQSGYPAVCDPSGKKKALATHRIPASRTNAIDGSTLYGAGLWAFRDSGGGTCGAMKFCYNGKLTSSATSTQAVGPFLGVSWRTHSAFASQTGVTADLEGNYGDIQTFYSKTADGTGVPHEVAKGVAIMAAFSEGPVRYRDAQSMALYVRYKLPSE